MYLEILNTKARRNIYENIKTHAYVEKIIYYSLRFGFWTHKTETYVELEHNH